MPCSARPRKRDPASNWAHVSLGWALARRGQFEEAIPVLRRAVELNPEHAGALIDLGEALRAEGWYDEAIVVLRKAIQREPANGRAYRVLGSALDAKGEFAEAIVALSKARDLEPQNPRVHLLLAEALQHAGRFADALKAVKEAQKHLSEAAVQTSDQLRVKLQQLIRTEEQLTDLLKDDAKIADDQRMLLAEVCQAKQLFAAASRFWKEALTAQTDGHGQRYAAAGAAARAGTGVGAEAAKLSAPERAAWRQLARTWLQDDLTWWAQQLDKNPPAEQRTKLLQTLRLWQQDAALTAVRDAKALGALPAGERAAWEELWSAVSALQAKAASKPRS